MSGLTLTRKSANRIARAVKQVEQDRREVPRPFRPELVPVRQRLGIIVSNGPEGEEDYLDDRYWVQRSFLGNTSDDQTERIEVREYAGDDPGFGIRTVANIAEHLDRTHALAIGTPVLMTSFATQGPNRARMWVMNVGGSGIKLRYCILREVVNELVLRVSGVTLTADENVIEVDDETTDASREPGIPTDWYEPLVWPGPPTIQTPFIYLTKIDGFNVALQKIKFPLIAPPDPQQFPPGPCFLLGG